MPNMKNKACDSNSSDLKQKERHIVSWSKEEDDILREQIGIHGTDNWVIIASKFEDKTTRQCRRRWFTYLNSNFKKHGWTPEEDMLLCEAQKKFGNRWTEIAKVISGRTDNAVKNRFSVLRKKKEMNEASTKENNFVESSNASTKRTQNSCGILETSMHHMKTRKHIAIKTEKRPPLAVLEQKNTSTDSKMGPTCKVEPKVDATTNEDVLPCCNKLNNNGVCPLPNSEFNSPIQVTPLFRTLAQGIPSPQFSESEKSFLLKTLGMESTATTRSSKSPLCKKALLNCL